MYLNSITRAFANMMRARATSNKFDPTSGTSLKRRDFVSRMLAQLLHRRVVMKGKYMYLSTVTSCQDSQSPWSHVFLA